jgi:hypothetical protein
MQIRITKEVLKDLLTSEKVDLSSALGKEALLITKKLFKADSSVSKKSQQKEVFSLDKNILILEKEVLLTGIVEIFNREERTVVYTYPITIDIETGILHF